MPGQIAQFIVPSDAIGSPAGIILDWPHLRAYLYNDKGIRSYSLTFATQNPIASVPTAPSGGFTVGCVDPSGNLIMATFDDAVSPFYKVDPNTLLVTGTWGTTGVFANYPDSMAITGSSTYVGNMACVQVSGVNYCLIKENIFSQHGGMIRTDTMVGAGFYDVISSGSVNGEALLCAGRSGASQGSFFVVDLGGVSTTTLGVHKVTINAGAQNWEPGSWPTPNPDISVSLLANLTTAAINNTWTGMTARGIGYDAWTGNVVLCLQSSTGSQNPAQMVVLNPNTGSIVSNTPIDPSPSGWISTNLWQTRMTLGEMAVLGTDASSIWDGFTVSIPDLVSPGTIPGLNIDANQGMFSDDVSQLIVADVQGFTEAAGTPTPVSGTPSSFSGWAMLEGLWPDFPPPIPPPNTLIAQAAGPVSLGRWRTRTGINWYGMALVGDAFSGVLGLSDFEVFTEYGNVMRFLITTPPIHEDRKRIFVPRFEIEVEAGTGIDGQPTTVPKMLLEWSKDGGVTWSTLKPPRSMGLIGEYIKRLRWLNLGNSRTWVFRLTCTDPVRRYIIGAYITDYKSLG